MKKILIALCIIAPSISFANQSIDSNVVLVKFNPVELGSYACVEQAKKNGDVVFKGVISKEEYKSKYSGFWLKDNTTCAYWKKTS
jgi:hypothetical protein